MTEPKEIFIIWNREQDRPAINKSAFGPWAVFSSMEQAQAALLDMLFKEDFFINVFVMDKKMITKVSKI